jgi:hypothetical protein
VRRHWPSAARRPRFHPAERPSDPVKVEIDSERSIEINAASNHSSARRAPESNGTQGLCEFSY